MPDAPSPQSIQAGDVITQSEVAIEVEKLLSDLYPLLRTVQPAEINYTLTALATRSRAAARTSARTWSILDDYLKRTNPQIPLLVDDLRKLGQVSDEYHDVVPELANLLRNSVTTGDTFVQKEEKIQALFSDVASFSSTSKDFLEQNGDNIIRLSEQGQEQLPLFAEYSSEYPCLLQSMVDVEPRRWRAPTAATPCTSTSRRSRGSRAATTCATTRSTPTAAARSARATAAPPPATARTTSPGTRYAPKLNDGVDYPVGKRVAPGFDLTSGFAGTSAEQSVVNAIAASAMGVASDEVPDVATLLFGPLARGTEVSVR